MSGERKGCINPDPRQRSLLEHGIALGEFSDSMFGSAQREAYIRQHGIVFADGDLFWAKDLEPSGTDSKRETSNADAARIAREVVGQGVGQQLRAPGKTFSRSETLAVLKSRKAVLDGRPTFHAAVRELETLADIFERME